MVHNPLPPAQALPRMRELLDRGRVCRLTVTGRSMYPFLRDTRDAVTLAKPDGPFRRGDILFYLRSPDFPILHRVHRVLPDGTLLLCGDAQRVMERVAPPQVMARVTHIVRDERIIPCTDRGYRLLVSLWMALFPLRRYILGVMRRLSRNR